MLKISQAKFLLYFSGTFLVLFTLLYSAGLVPAAFKANEGDTFRIIWDKAINKMASSTAESPTRITIAKIGVDINVINSKTTDIATLDEYLTQGVVRYPGSGLLGEGNMFIFGHSSNLAVVHNPAYAAFSNLKKLSVGDEIKVYSASGRIYAYRVTSVTLVDENKALVDFSGTKNMLTLSTCNTLGAPSERYVVEADYSPGL